MQSSSSGDLNKTSAMVWWTLLADLNTDRHVLVEVELQKHSLDSWRGWTEINMAYVSLQMSKHVSHIPKSLCVLWNNNKKTEESEELPGVKSACVLCVYRMEISGIYTQRRQRKERPSQTWLSRAYKSEEVRTRGSFSVYSLTWRNGGVGKAPGTRARAAPPAYLTTALEAESGDIRCGWDAEDGCSWASHRTVDRTRSIRSWIQLTAHSHARLVRALPNHYHYLSCSLLERQRHTPEQTAGDRDENNNFNIYSPEM